MAGASASSLSSLSRLGARSLPPDRSCTKVANLLWVVLDICWTVASSVATAAIMQCTTCTSEISINLAVCGVLLTL